MRKRVPSLLAGLAVAAAVTACGSNNTTATDTGAGSTSASASGSGIGSAPPKDVTCSYPSDGNAAKQVQPPPAKPLAGGTVQATIATSAGDVPITLDADKAPCTVNSFVSLVQQHYFDGTPCHRLTTKGIYVLQCGDPSGTGMGGPGYSFADELSGHDTYPKGTLAMANSGADTNGSQFFLCYGDCSALNQQPNYTVFGNISDAGLQVLAKVAQAGTANGSTDGAPKDHVKITSVTLG